MREQNAIVVNGGEKVKHRFDKNSSIGLLAAIVSKKLAPLNLVICSLIRLWS